MTTWKDIKNPKVILRAEVGSRLYGTNLGDSGDSDQLGICVEPMADLVGFSEFEQYVYRTASEREGASDAPSQAGDLDLTIYGLRKFLRLALKGNPTIIQLLFIPQSKWICGDARGSHLQELAPAIVSRAVGGAFLGYLQAQRMRFTGERGGTHGRAHVNDQEKYGYDTKYAMHMLRLGYQGVELLTTGRLTFPVPEAGYLLEVRSGKSNPQEILTRTGELEREIKGLLGPEGSNTSPLPAQPAREVVQEWMLKTYWFSWKADHGHPDNKLFDRLELLNDK